MSSHAIVVMNERHSLIKEQKALFDLQFSSWEIKYIEDEKWSHSYFIGFQEELEDSGADHIVFVSPCSLLIAEMSYLCGYNNGIGQRFPNIWILHSTKRVEKQFGSSVRLLPDANSYILVPMRT